ncbi:MAG: PEGA domain-containing protein [Polyangiaceae bacterium]
MRTRFVLGTLLSLVLTQAAPRAAFAADAPAEDPRRAEARAHFERGVEHVDRSEWDAALVEFLASRAALSTSKNTYNAAVCLRKTGRFDEALEMYEALLRDFPDLEAKERQVAERELSQLKASVATITIEGGVPRAKVVVDGRERGTLPLAAPLRVGAGTHTIRVSADGYMPFEARVDVAGMQAVTVKPQMSALTAGGRLNVAEQTGKNLDVVVDGATVGKTPWDGVLAPGEHTVYLRGEGNVGTVPVRPNVELGQVVSLALLAEELPAQIRIVPTPASAAVFLDGVELGRGGWEGRIRPGKHKVRASAEGFLPNEIAITAERGKPAVAAVKLSPDPKALGLPNAGVALELDAALPIGLVAGGGADLSDACTGACSQGVPFGFHGVLHGAYQTSSGFGAGIDAGYLFAVSSLSDRETVLTPRGRAGNRGTVDDTLRLSGITLGGSAQYHGRGSWPLLLRVGAGIWLGQVTDARSGSFTNLAGEPYTVDAKTSSSATYFYVAPEARIAKSIAKNLEVTFGMEVLVMAALKKATWSDGTTISTSNTGRGDGLATFGEQQTLGSFLLFLAPSVGLRYDF